MILTASAVAFLSACAPSWKLSSPPDGSHVMFPDKIHVNIASGPNMRGLVVKLDGADVTYQIAAVTDVSAEGDVNAAVGSHVITFDADVSCWYCWNQLWHYSDSRTVCVGENEQNVITKIAHAKGDDKSWIKTSDTTVGMAPACSHTPINVTDDAMLNCRWNFFGHASTGFIKSAEDSCLSMRFTVQRRGIPITLAVYDSNDVLQKWQSLPSQSSPGFFSFQNLGTLGCLAEGPNDTLIQSDCHDVQEQLWHIFDVTTQTFEDPFNN